MDEVVSRDRFDGQTSVGRSDSIVLIGIVWSLLLHDATKGTLFKWPFDDLLPDNSNAEPL